MTGKVDVAAGQPGGTLLAVGTAWKIARPASRGASIILTIGTAVLLVAFVAQPRNLCMSGERTRGRFLRLLGANLYVMGSSLPYSSLLRLR
jgi:hypothetical protein